MRAASPRVVFDTCMRTSGIRERFSTYRRKCQVGASLFACAWASARFLHCLTHRHAHVFLVAVRDRRSASSLLLTGGALPGASYPGSSRKRVVVLSTVVCNTEYSVLFRSTIYFVKRAAEDCFSCRKDPMKNHAAYMPGSHQAAKRRKRIG